MTGIERAAVIHLGQRPGKEMLGFAKLSTATDCVGSQPIMLQELAGQTMATGNG
jgi:hypothetical protein